MVVLHEPCVVVVTGDPVIYIYRVTGEGVRIQPSTSKLEDLGFRFKYGVEETLDCSVECAKRLGEL